MTMRPQWYILRNGNTISPNHVIKRTHSDCGNHVLKPGNPRRYWDYLAQHQIPGSVWFSQEYIKELDVLGEWRVFIIGGNIVYIVHTKRHKNGSTWKWEPVHSFYSLKELE